MNRLRACAAARSNSALPTPWPRCAGNTESPVRQDRRRRPHGPRRRARGDRRERRIPYRGRNRSCRRRRRCLPEKATSRTAVAGPPRATRENAPSAALALSLRRWTATVMMKSPVGLQRDPEQRRSSCCVHLAYRSALQGRPAAGGAHRQCRSRTSPSAVSVHHCRERSGCATSRLPPMHPRRVRAPVPGQWPSRHRRTADAARRPSPDVPMNPMRSHTPHSTKACARFSFAVQAWDARSRFDLAHFSNQVGSDLRRHDSTSRGCRVQSPRPTRSKIPLRHGAAWARVARVPRRSVARAVAGGCAHALAIREEMPGPPICSLVADQYASATPFRRVSRSSRRAVDVYGTAQMQLGAFALVRPIIVLNQ